MYNTGTGITVKYSSSIEPFNVYKRFDYDCKRRGGGTG